ncbi:MAG TPA: MaoC family dehydratase [Vicinamibacterales bacterium]|nr:MaoC family dehydratase [Vicinamibacterales bacterium]
MVTIDIRALVDNVGRELGVSEWHQVTQERIDEFADATGDRQWIHVDRARAASESPFKTTIAHGFLTLSLASSLIRSALQFDGARMAINYGLNRVRFMAPVPSGSRVRGRFALASVEETGGAVQAIWQVTIEREGIEKPCCVAEWLVRYYPA